MSIGFRQGYATTTAAFQALMEGAAFADLKWDKDHNWLNIGGFPTPYAGALGPAGVSIEVAANTAATELYIANTSTGANAQASWVLAANGAADFDSSYFGFQVFGPGNTSGAPYGPQAGGMTFYSQNGANLVITNQSLGTPPGGDIVFQAGTGAAEGFRLKGGGQLQFKAPNFTGNGAVATALTALGPAGSHTTVQEWLAIQNNAGVVRYLPCF